MLIPVFMFGIVPGLCIATRTPVSKAKEGSVLITSDIVFGKSLMFRIKLDPRMSPI